MFFSSFLYFFPFPISLTPQSSLGGPYRRFGMEFENGMKMCDKEKEKNSDWKSVMQQLDEYVSAHTKLSFASYYITPIQRVPRYVILIRDLIKATNERHAGTAFVFVFVFVFVFFFFFFFFFV
jgi:hypothetical protein